MCKWPFLWKRPCLFSVQRACSFAYRLFCRMSSVCCLFRSRLRRIYEPVSSVHSVNWNAVTVDVDELTSIANPVELHLLPASSNCDSSNMADADGSAVSQSQVWKRMLSFKRKLFGSSSVLPTATLDMVTEKSGSMLSQQSNSAEMSENCSCSPKCAKLDDTHKITVPGSTVVFISEDSRPLLNKAEEHQKSAESLDDLSLGDDLFALFDSDNQMKTDAIPATSSSRSMFLTLSYTV